MPTSYGGGGGIVVGAPHACCCGASINSAAMNTRPLGDRIRIRICIRICIRTSTCTGGDGRPRPERGPIAPWLRMPSDPAQWHPDG